MEGLGRQADRLRELIRNSRHAVVSPRRGGIGGSQIISVTSGKGGVGKTNLLVSLSIAVARRGYGVLIFDADLGLANVDILLGVTPRYNLLHVIRGEKEIHEIVVDCPGGVKLVPGGAGVEELANLTDEERMRFIGEMGALEEMADYIFVDTGAGIGRNVMGFVLSSDRAIVVTTPEPTSMRDSYGVIKAIFRYPSAPEVSLVVNMARDEREGVEVAERMRMVVSQFLGYGIDFLGYVFEDRSVLEAVRKRVPFYLDSPRSDASLCVEAIASRLLGESEEVSPPYRGRGIKSFMFRLARYFAGGALR